MNARFAVEYSTAHYIVIKARQVEATSLPKKVQLLGFQHQEARTKLEIEERSVDRPT